MREVGLDDNAPVAPFKILSAKPSIHSSTDRQS